MTSASGTSAPRSMRNRRAQITTIVFAVVILIPSMLGFVAKFIEFTAVFRGTGEGAFAVTAEGKRALAKADAA